MIYLREITEDDLKYINNARNDKEMAEKLATPFRYANPETDRLWFKEYMENRNCNLHFAVCHIQTFEVLGIVSLSDIDWVSRCAVFNVHIGNPMYRGIGAGKMAVQEMLKHAFFDLNLNRIQVEVLEEHATAIHLFRQSGFKEEGKLREAVFKDNQAKDVLVMGLLKREYTG